MKVAIIVACSAAAVATSACLQNEPLFPLAVRDEPAAPEPADQPEPEPEPVEEEPVDFCPGGANCFPPGPGAPQPECSGVAVVLDVGGYFYDLVEHEGGVVVASSVGTYFLEDEAEPRLIDPAFSWRVRSHAGEIYALVDEGVLRLSDTGPVVIASSSFNLHDFDVRGDQLFLSEEAWDIDTPDRFRVVDLVTGEERSTNVQGSSRLTGDDQAMWGGQHNGIRRFGIGADQGEGAFAVPFSFGAVDQLLSTPTSIYFSQYILPGGVGRIDKATGRFEVFTFLGNEYVGGMVAEDGSIYWSLTGLPLGGQDRVERISNDGGDAELVTDCIREPGALLVHNGFLYVASGLFGQASSLVSRLPLP